MCVYRASISRTVGLVVAPCEAANARGEDAPRFHVGKPRHNAKPSALASGSMIPSIERRGGPSPMLLPVVSRAIGRPARAVPRIPMGAIVNARATPVERNRKGE